MSLQLAVVSLGPDVLAGLGVDELAGDADPLAGRPDAALEHVAHAELARDLPHVDRLALVDEARVAGDDEEPAQARERRDDVLGDAVGEIVLLGVAAHVGEGQDGDRGLVERLRAGRPRARPRPPARGGVVEHRRAARAPVWLSTIARVRSEKRPISSLSTVDLPSLVLKANCSREIRCAGEVVPDRRRRRASVVHSWPAPRSSSACRRLRPELARSSRHPAGSFPENPGNIRKEPRKKSRRRTASSAMRRSAGADLRGRRCRCRRPSATARSFGAGRRRLPSPATAVLVLALALLRSVEAVRKRSRAKPPPDAARRPGSTRISQRCRSTRSILPSRRNIRSGPMEPQSGAGSRCRPVPPSTRPTRTPGSFRSAHACGRSSPSTASASKRATSSARPTVSGSMPLTPGARTAARRSSSPERGRRDAYPLGGGRSHTIPGVGDCKACHQGGRSEVLGFSALQLSPDRDPGALHAELRPDAGIDLQLPRREGPARRAAQVAAGDSRRAIAAASATERAALGYLHGNCGHCHNEQGPLQNIGLFLRQSLGRRGAAAIASTVGHPVKKPAPGQSAGRGAAHRAGPSGSERAGAAYRLALPCPADAAARNRTGRRGSGRVARRWIAETESPASKPTSATRRRHDDEPCIAADIRGRLARVRRRSRPRRRASAQVKRGEYLVTIGLCHDCHTPLVDGAGRPGAGHEAGAVGPPAGHRRQGAGEARRAVDRRLPPRR